jgi:hypothetical protein
MKSEDEEKIEGYTMEEFHALLLLLVDLKPEYREFIEKYFADDMTPKQRLEYIEKTRTARSNRGY